MDLLPSFLPMHQFSVAFFTVALVHTALAGSCWMDVDRSLGKNVCSGFLMAHVTREECCNAKPRGEKFYSEDDSSVAPFDLKFLLTPHRCGMACNDGCNTFQSRCKETERCKVKNGVPRCLCDPSCSKHSLQWKGKLCGSDGLTYRSHCQMLRQNCRRNRQVKPNYFGHCKAYSCDGVVCAEKGAKCIVDQYNTPVCIATPSYCDASPPATQRVCATNNATFGSVCLLNAYNVQNGARLRVQHMGACRAEMTCGQDPACKHCLRDRASASHVCLQEDVCPDCAHAAESPPVCGDDGVTYDSECQLRRTACLTRVNLTVKHIDSCNASLSQILYTTVNGRRGLEDDVFQRLIEQTLAL